MTLKKSDAVKNPSVCKGDLVSEGDLFCHKLNVNIEMREGDAWVAFDFLNDCNDESVLNYLQNLQAIHPNHKFRALNRTTGRLVNFL